MAFTEILAIIVLSFIAGSVTTILVALNYASKDSNKRDESKLENKEDNTNGRSL